MTTKDSIDQLIIIINNRIASQSTNRNVYIERAYGKPRAFMDTLDSQGNVLRTKELSPRLTRGELRDWLDAFEVGLGMGLDIIAEDRAAAAEIGTWEMPSICLVD